MKIKAVSALMDPLKEVDWPLFARQFAGKKRVLIQFYRDGHNLMSFTLHLAETMGKPYYLVFEKGTQTYEERMPPYQWLGSHDRPWKDCFNFITCDQLHETQDSPLIIRDFWMLELGDPGKHRERILEFLRGHNSVCYFPQSAPEYHPLKQMCDDAKFDALLEYDRTCREELERQNDIFLKYYTPGKDIPMIRNLPAMLCISDYFLPHVKKATTADMNAIGIQYQRQHKDSIARKPNLKMTITKDKTPRQRGKQPQCSA